MLAISPRNSFRCMAAVDYGLRIRRKRKKAHGLVRVNRVGAGLLQTKSSACAALIRQ
jgi:hypothetical protein